MRKKTSEKGYRYLFYMPRAAYSSKEFLFREGFTAGKWRGNLLWSRGVLSIRATRDLRKREDPLPSGVLYGHPMEKEHA